MKNNMKSTCPTRAPSRGGSNATIFQIPVLGVGMGGNTNVEVRVWSARLFRYMMASANQNACGGGPTHWLQCVLVEYSLNCFARIID